MSMKFNTATWGTVLWPAFLGAAVGDGLLFTLIDPESLEVFGSPTVVSRRAAYTIGFFVFWFIIVGSSLLTLWLNESNEGKPVE
jgi:hypothetical protein